MIGCGTTSAFTKCTVVAVFGLLHQCRLYIVPFTRQGHQEFVIFAKAQAYPTSLITDLVIVWSLPYLYMDILVL